MSLDRTPVDFSASRLPQVTDTAMTPSDSHRPTTRALQRRLAPALAVLAAAALSACAGLPGTPASHPALLTTPVSSTVAASPAATPAHWPSTQAWDRWGDAQLRSLIDTALAQQPALQAVQARLGQAAAAVATTRATSGLTVNASVDLTEQRFTENGMVPKPLAGTTAWNNTAQFSGSWEWDLFGRQSAQLASALGQQRAAQAEAQAARNLLAANVASAYVGLARGLALKGLSAESLKQREAVMALVRQRIAAGLDTTVELRQAEALIAQSRTELAAADEQIARSRHALAELTGQAPRALDALSPQLANASAQALPSSLPVDLLGRRADLVAQRWRVEAATQDVAVARAQFYPNINIVGFAGLSSLGLNTLFDSGSLSAGIGPALRLPVFEGGRLRANLGARNAEVDAAIAGYNGTLLRALREVADEVSTLQAIEQQQGHQADALRASEQAFELAVKRYQAGLGNFLIVLNADTQVLAQRRATAELKARHLTAEASLSRALGGGFSAEAPETTQAAAAEQPRV
jgi:NodT family efflux transporter outer membrane factor (OMF) lipoprotein